MATAEELLNSLTVEDHIVVGSDRRITVPAALKRIAVQYDHDIETVTFDCPRYWDGIDMSKMDIYVNYKRSDGYKDINFVKNVRIDETDETIMHFDWTITRNVTMVKGTITMSICIKETDAKGNEVRHWNSELNNEMSVSEGLECSEHIEEEYPDVLAKIVKKVDSIIDDDNNTVLGDSGSHVIMKGVKNTLIEGEDNTALSSNVHIDGSKNTVGCKAYRILESYPESSSYLLDNVEGLEPGDVYSIRVEFNYDNHGTIISVDKSINEVVVDNFINDKLIELTEEQIIDINVTQNTFRISEKPHLGTIDWGSNARSSGVSNRVHGDAASADGRSNIITGRYGRASGYLNKTGYAGHVQNRSNTALGIDASGSGRDTVADGERSFTMGHGTVAKAKDQLARGKYNIPDNGQNYADIVGNGKDDNNRSNAYTLDWNGNGWFAGSITTEGIIIANDIKLPYLKEITVDGETTIDRTLKKSSGSIIQNIKVDDIDVFNLSDKNIELSATKKYHDNLVIVNGKISVIKNIRKLTIDSRFGKYWKQATAKSSSGGRTFSKRFYIDINSLIDSEGNTLLTPEELEIFNKGEMVFFTDSGYSSHFSTYITKQPYTHDRFYLDQSSSEYIRLHIFDTNATNILVSANDESIYHEIGSIEIPEGEYDIRTESIDFYFGIVSPKTIDIETLYSEEWKNLIKLYNHDSVVSANAISDFNDEVSEISLNTNVILDNFVDMIADLKTKNYTTDSEMSDESTNPVQNKVVKKYIDDILGDVEKSLENIIAKYGLGGDGV